MPTMTADASARARSRPPRRLAGPAAPLFSMRSEAGISSHRMPATLRLRPHPGASTADASAGASVGRTTTSLGHFVRARQPVPSRRGSRVRCTARPASSGSQSRRAAGTTGRRTTDTVRAPWGGVTHVCSARPRPAVCVWAHRADRWGQVSTAAGFTRPSGPLSAARRSSLVEPVTRTVRSREKKELLTAAA